MNNSTILQQKGWVIVTKAKLYYSRHDSRTKLFRKQNRMFERLEEKIIKKLPMFFTLFFVLITVLIISSLILIMVSDQDMDHIVSQYEDDIEPQQDGKPASDYWTKERMQEAEPVSMPTASILDKFKELIIRSFPVLLILFIILTAFLTLTNMRNIKLIEKQNENILKKVSKKNETWDD